MVSMKSHILSQQKCLQHRTISKQFLIETRIQTLKKNIPSMEPREINWTGVFTMLFNTSFQILKSFWDNP